MFHRELRYDTFMCLRFLQEIIIGPLKVGIKSESSTSTQFIVFGDGTLCSVFTNARIMRQWLDALARYCHYLYFI